MPQQPWKIGLVAALVVAGCTSEPEPSGSRAAEGDDAPPPRVLAEALAANDLAGKVTLIGFGAAGSERSDASFEEMLALARSEAIGSPAYLRVEMLPRSEATEAYYRDRGVPFPVVYDEQVHLAHSLGVRTVPMFMLVGKFGRVRYRGSLPAGPIGEWVGALAAERVDPGPRVPLFGERDPDVGALLASTRLPGLDAPVRPLGSYAGDRGLVIVFIDTATPQAAAAGADLPTVGAELARVGVPVVAVNLDDEQAVRDHYAGEVLGVPVLFDDTAGTTLRWRVDAVPLVVFIDGDGRIAYRGPPVWDALGAVVAGNAGP
ncbi:MAG: TlpA family protein disulfide reductase [Planctomycetota bacterium]